MPVYSYSTVIQYSVPESKGLAIVRRLPATNSSRKTLYVLYVAHDVAESARVLVLEVSFMLSVIAVCFPSQVSMLHGELSAYFVCCLDKELLLFSGHIMVR
jgi:hypothetical protein